LPSLKKKLENFCNVNKMESICKIDSLKVENTVTHKKNGAEGLQLQ